MAVLRSCALQRLRVRGVREKQAGGRARWYRVDICHMCLFIRNKAAPRERDRYSPESDLAEAWYSLSRGREEGRRSAAALYRSYTCTYSTVKALEPIHTQREIDTHTHSKSTTGRPSSVIFAMGSLSPIIKWCLGILSQTKARRWFISSDCHDKWSSSVKILFV